MRLEYLLWKFQNSLTLIVAIETRFGVYHKLQPTLTHVILHFDNLVGIFIYVYYLTVRKPGHYLYAYLQGVIA